MYADVRSGETPPQHPKRFFTAQLYCQNDDSQIVTSGGGTLHEIRVHGRRVGNESFTLDARIDTGRDTARTASVIGASMSSEEVSVRFAFDPLKIERGDRYRVTLRAHDATPSSRPALAYVRNRSAELMRFDDRPLDGSLELEEVFE